MEPGIVFVANRHLALKKGNDAIDESFAEGPDRSQINRMFLHNNFAQWLRVNYRGRTSACQKKVTFKNRLDDDHNK
jgi:hypothetical protein